MPPPVQSPSPAQTAFAGLAGLWLALALLKLGNPVILEDRIATPGDWLQVVHQSWPVKWGYAGFGVLFLTGLVAWHRRGARTAHDWLLMLPAAWLAWQGLSALQTVDRTLTAAVLPHFAVCTGAFYLGLFVLARVRRMTVFWLGLCGGFVAVVALGWRQHFGGLEQARNFFYQLPDWQSYPPEFLRKLASDRISSTLFYPNALAGALLLLTPVCLTWLWECSGHWPRAVRWLAVGGIGTGSLACLYWSGSKAGWLITSGMVLLAWWNNARLAREGPAVSDPAGPRHARGWIVLGLLGAGLAVFAVKNADYFRRGATSVVARFDYWQVAARCALREPLLGSGPGTFMTVYRQSKPPEAEMTRLVHNDYLQQASDSGMVGFLCHTGFLAGSLVALRRRVWHGAGPLAQGVWLGLTGLAIQGLVEFGLYVPALAWTQFLLLGWLWGVSGNDESHRLAPAGSLGSPAR